MKLSKEEIIQNAQKELQALRKYVCSEANHIIQNHNGNIKKITKIEKDKFKSLLNSVPNKDPNKKNKHATVSLRGVEENINEAVEKFLTQNKGEENSFDELSNEIKSFRKELEKDISSNEGIKALAEEDLKLSITKSTPFNNDKDRRLVQESAQYIKVPSLLLSKLGENSVEKTFGNIIREHMRKCFAPDDLKQEDYFFNPDITKLLSQGKNFADLINKDLYKFVINQIIQEGLCANLNKQTRDKLKIFFLGNNKPIYNQALTVEENNIIIIANNISYILGKINDDLIFENEQDISKIIKSASKKYSYDKDFDKGKKEFLKNLDKKIVEYFDDIAEKNIKKIESL